MIEQIKAFFEKQAFGVCTRLGEIMHISTSSIRLFFIYASFLTLGSPLLVYMGLVFLRNMRKHWRRQRNPLAFEL
jgi:phage shock protein PspC (stress-responsive transcriptional regulator)